MLPRHYDVMQDTAGNVLAGATVTVKTWQGAPATLYADRGGTTPLGSNILTSDSKGQISFFAAPGFYSLEVAKAGYESYTMSDVTLPFVDTRLTAAYFGIPEGANDLDITSNLQTWIYDVIEHSAGVVASGRVRCGIIELPYGNFVVDSLITHPAVSFYGSNRTGTRLKLKDNATPVGQDAVPAMFYILARTQEVQATGAWSPMFKHMRLSGNKSNQGTQFAYGIYCEKGENDPHYTDYLAGGTELKSYSAIHAENVEVEAFSGDGIRANGDRQRLMLFGRTRSINHGIMSGDTIVTQANGVHILGNDPVIDDCGFGGCTGHSVSVAGCSGLLMRGTNVWGTTSAARSEGALAIHMQNVNGFSIVGNTINDTVSFFGAEGANDDRAFTFIGNHLKPNKAVFSSDGVPVGTGNTSANAFLRVRGYKNAVIGLNDYSADSLGRRYEYLATFTDGAVGFIQFAASTQESSLIKPWHTSQAVPLYISGDSKASMLMHDPYRDMHRISGSLVIDMNANTEPDHLTYSLIHAGAKPALFGNRVHREKGDSLIPAKAQSFESPTSGDNYVVSEAKARVTFYSSNPLNALTVTLPDTPDDGHELELVFHDGVKALTLAMGDPLNQSLFSDPITRIPPGTTLKLTFKGGVLPAGQWWVTSTRDDWLEPRGATSVNMTNAGSLSMTGENVHVHLKRDTVCTDFTVNLPTAPLSGETRRVSIHQAVTAWTLAPGAGHTLHTTDTWPTTIPAGGYTLEVQFLNDVWYRVHSA